MKTKKAQVLKAGLLYFALVFAAGFVMGIVRTLWIVPRLGARTAEFMEAPIMLLVTFTAAHWTMRRLAVPATCFDRLRVGGFALSLLLLSEFTLVLWLRGQSIIEYIANRDPATGSVYYLLLGIFAIAPSFVVRQPTFETQRQTGLQAM